MHVDHNETKATLPSITGGQSSPVESTKRDNEISSYITMCDTVVLANIKVYGSYDNCPDILNCKIYLDKLKLARKN